MGQLSLSGSLIAGPPCSGTDQFPSSVTTLALALQYTPKGFGVATGILQRNIAVSNESWVTLSGVGATDTVTKCDTIYIRSNGPLTMELTTDDGTGTNTNVVSLIPLNGLALLEFNENKWLKLVRLSGTATIEYFACGLQ